MRLFTLAFFALTAGFVCAQKPYAVLSEDNTTLTFYYDDNMQKRGGLDVANYYGNAANRAWNDACEQIQTVAFDPSFANYTYLHYTARWFYGCSALTKVEGMEYLNTENVYDMTAMFSRCSSLPSIDLSHMITSNVVSMEYLFYGCEALTSLDVSHFDTSNVETMRGLFYGCSALTSIDVSHFNTSKVTTMRLLFNKCSSITSLDLSSFDTSRVEDMGAMFQNCASLEQLDLSHFVTFRVTNMSYMFNYCSALKSVDVSNFETWQVTDMSRMFNNCCALESVDVSNFATGQVVDMQSMFNYCYALKSVDVSNFDTERVTNMRYMFNRCYGLPSVDLSNFDTRNVTDMECMFSECTAMTSIDLGSFDTHRVKDMAYMFSDSPLLKAIYVGYLWSTDSVETGEGMFENSPALVGEKGTVYDAQHTGHEYARVDGGAEAPGYLTAEPAADGVIRRTAVDGLDWTYIIVSEKDKTCQVGGDKVNSRGNVTNVPAIDRETTGAVTIPSVLDGYKVVAIGEGAFEYCEMSSVVVPVGVTRIEEDAFMGCENLTSVSLPEGLTFIGEEVFDYCPITEITLPESLVRIGEQAFEGTRLTSIYLPKNVAFLGNEDRIDEYDGEIIEEDDLYGDVFRDCMSLKEVKVDAANETYADVDGILYTKDLKTLLYCPDAKQTAVVPEGVENIYEDAFEESCVVSVVLPSTLKTVGEYAFAICEDLTDVYTLATTPPSAIENAFAMYYDSDDDWWTSYPVCTATLHVLPGCKAAYESATGWNAFREIVEDAQLSGITSAATTASPVVRSYSLDGRRATSQPGITIRQRSDGTVEKVLVK